MGPRPNVANQPLTDKLGGTVEMPVLNAQKSSSSEQRDHNAQPHPNSDSKKLQYDAALKPSHELWFCCKCGYFPHNSKLSLRCIICNHDCCPDCKVISKSKTAEESDKKIQGHLVTLLLLK